MKNPSIQIFNDHKEELLTLWIKHQSANEFIKQSLISDTEMREQSVELLDTFVSSLNDLSLDNASFEDSEKVLDLLTAISIKRAKQGFSPRETGVFIFGLKEALLKVISTEIPDPMVKYEQSIKVGNLLDSLSIFTFENFIKSREEVILRQTDEMSAISTPVIQVWDGVLALPIIGTLDSERTQVVMENLLMAIVETESSIAILDISGVPAIDTMVAQHLLKTVSATRLMGAECIISGIRPEIAQTVVHLGIDLSGVITKSTLADALKSAYKLMELEVKRRRPAVA